MAMNDRTPAGCLSLRGETSQLDFLRLLEHQYSDETRMDCL